MYVCMYVCVCRQAAKRAGFSTCLAHEENFNFLSLCLPYASLLSFLVLFSLLNPSANPVCFCNLIS